MTIRPAARGLLLELIQAGATHLVLAPALPWPDAPARWLAGEVAGPVAAEAALADRAVRPAMVRSDSSQRSAAGSR